MNEPPMRNSDLEIVCRSAPTVAQNLALDETTVRTASETGRHSLRFWWGGPPAVVVGFSEKIDQAVDAAACRTLGVDVLKRSTGGGSVLQTGGVFNYSLVMPFGSNYGSKASLPVWDGSHNCRSEVSRFGRKDRRDFRCSHRRPKDLRKRAGAAAQGPYSPRHTARGLRL